MLGTQVLDYEFPKAKAVKARLATERNTALCVFSSLYGPPLFCLVSFRILAGIFVLLYLLPLLRSADLSSLRWFSPPQKRFANFAYLITRAAEGKKKGGKAGTSWERRQSSSLAADKTARSAVPDQKAAALHST